MDVNDTLVCVKKREGGMQKNTRLGEKRESQEKRGRKTTQERRGREKGKRDGGGVRGGGRGGTEMMKGEQRDKQKYGGW